MSAIPGCQTAISAAIRLRTYARNSNPWTLPVLALLALLGSMGASLHAQTASFSGSTSALDTTDFTGPQGIATDTNGDVFIADSAKLAVYEMTRTGPGAYSAPVALPGLTTGSYTLLRGVAIDSNGNLWVADYANYPTTPGQVYELVYNSTSHTFAAPAKVGTGWESPWAITADASGNVFVTDNSANTISEISGGTVTVKNTGGVTQPRGIAVNSSEDLFVIDGNVDRVMELAPPYTSASTVNNTEFQGPGDIALDATGNIWVAEYSTNLVRELTSASNYATILSWGSGLNGPLAVWPDADGALLVSDYDNGAIEQIAQAVNVGTVAVGSGSGTQTLTFTFTGAANTTIQAPVVVTQGGTGLDFADAGTGTCTTTHGSGNPWAPQSTCTVNVNMKPKYAGARYGAVNLLDTSGNLLATGYIYGTGSAPQLVFPSNTSATMLGGGFTGAGGVAVDASGNVYVADTNALKEIPSGCTSSSCVRTLASGFTPDAVALDGSGNVFVTDNADKAVKEIPAGCTTSSCVTTLGGGFTGPAFVAVDRNGNVYVTDVDDTDIPQGFGWVKEIPPGCTSASCVVNRYGEFYYPEGVAVDGNDNLYVVENGHDEVYKIQLNCTSNCMTYWGPGNLGVAVDGSGNVYLGGYLAVDDSGNIYTPAETAVQELNLGTSPSLSFASTNVGSLSSPQAVTLKNIGTAPLVFAVPATGFNPSVAAGFVWDDASTCTQTAPGGSAFSLPAAGSCTVQIEFQPTAPGTNTGSVVLTDNNLNATNAMQSVSLSGTGQAASTTTTASNQTATFSSSSQSITLSATVTNTGGTVNSGTVTFTVLHGATPVGAATTSGTVSAGNASVSYILPAGTAAGTYTIQASYTGAGGFVSSSDNTHRLTVTAAPVAVISPSSIDFGTLRLGSIVTKTVTVTNKGDATMTISDPLFAVDKGGDSDEFITINLCPKSLAAGKSCVMTVTFIAGPVYTPQTATLTINDNAAGSPQSVPLTATVTNPGGRPSGPGFGW